MTVFISKEGVAAVSADVLRQREGLVSHEGELEMAKKPSPSAKKWRKCHVMVAKNNVYVFKHAYAAVEETSLRLTKSTDVRKENAPKKSFCFSFGTRNARYYFNAPGEVELEAWIDQLKIAIHVLGGNTLDRPASDSSVFVQPFAQQSQFFDPPHFHQQFAQPSASQYLPPQNQPPPPQQYGNYGQQRRY